MIRWTFKGTVEASEMGWRPGHWPQEVTVTLPAGNKVKLTRTSSHTQEGETMSVTYTEEGFGHELVVYND